MPTTVNCYQQHTGSPAEYEGHHTNHVWGIPQQQLLHIQVSNPMPRDNKHWMQVIPYNLITEPPNH